MIKAWVLMIVLVGDQTGLPSPPVWRQTQEQCRAALLDTMEAMQQRDRAIHSAMCVEVEIPFLAAAFMGVAK